MPLNEAGSGFFPLAPILKTGQPIFSHLAAFRGSGEKEGHLVIWHSVLAAVELDAGEAERKLRETDRLDLIRWLADSQRESLRW